MHARDLTGAGAGGHTYALQALLAAGGSRGTDGARALLLAACGSAVVLLCAFRGEYRRLAAERDERYGVLESGAPDGVGDAPRGARLALAASGGEIGDRPLVVVPRE